MRFEAKYQDGKASASATCSRVIEYPLPGASISIGFIMLPGGYGFEIYNALRKEIVRKQ